MNTQPADRLDALEGAWKQTVSRGGPQVAAARALLARVESGGMPCPPALREQLEGLLAQYDSAAGRIEGALPAARKARRRINALERQVARQMRLSQFDDLLDGHPGRFAPADLISCMVNVWLCVCAGEVPPLGRRAEWEAVLAPAEARILEALRRRFFRPRRVSSLVIVGCENPFWVPALWGEVRVNVAEPDAQIFRWIRSLGDYCAQLGIRAFAASECREIEIGHIVGLPEGVFDLVWLGEGFWGDSPRFDEAELGAGLAQLSLRVPNLAVSVAGAEADAAGKILRAAGYRVDPYVEGEPLFAASAGITAGSSLFVSGRTMVYDSGVERLRAGARPATCPGPAISEHVVEAETSPEPLDMPGPVRRVRLACAGDQAVLSFLAVPGGGTPDQLARDHAAQMYAGLDGLCPAWPGLARTQPVSPRDLVLQLSGIWSRPLWGRGEGEEIDWEALWGAVAGLMAALGRRGMHLSGLRPGWFVETDRGWWFCGPGGVSREEVEDEISAIWWFFHDAAVGRVAWREEPVPPPEGDLPDVLPAALRERLTRLTAFHRLADALARGWPDPTF